MTKFTEHNMVKTTNIYKELSNGTIACDSPVNRF